MTVEEISSSDTSIEERYYEKKPTAIVEVALDEKESFYARYGHSYNGDPEDPINKSYDFVWQKAIELPYPEAVQILQEALEYHDGDSNFPDDLRLRIEHNLKDEEKIADEMEVKSDAAMIRFFSPYAEIRAVTEPFDDQEVPIETIR